MKNVIPNLTGYEALYGSHTYKECESEKNGKSCEHEKFRREVIGFDEHGNPLVLYGDQLTPVSKATQFAKYPKYLHLVQEARDGETLNDVIFKAVRSAFEEYVTWSQHILASIESGITAAFAESAPDADKITTALSEAALELVRDSAPGSETVAAAIAEGVRLAAVTDDSNLEIHD